MRALCLICGVLLFTSQLCAQVSVTLPLDGYYRAGRYMPVEIAVQAAQAAGGELSISADGAIPTVIGSPRPGIVPLLFWNNAADKVSCQIGSTSLASLPVKRLEANQRLVAVSDASLRNAARLLFPDFDVIVIDHPHWLLREPLAAWDTLDAIIFQSAPSQQQLQSLLAGISTVAIAQPHKPDNIWPWIQRENLWVISLPRTGPGVISSAAYDPAQIWNPGQPVEVRKRWVVWLFIATLILFGISLLRSRFAVPVIVLACAACCFTFWWRGKDVTVLRVSGAIELQQDNITQRDNWTYNRHLYPLTGNQTFLGNAKPIFASVKQIERTQIRLSAQENSPGIFFRYYLEPGWTLAFRETKVMPTPTPAIVLHLAKSPLQELAPLYLWPGSRIMGETTEAPPGGKPRPQGKEYWPVLVIGAK